MYETDLGMHDITVHSWTLEKTTKMRGQGQYHNWSISVSILLFCDQIQVTSLSEGNLIFLKNTRTQKANRNNVKEIKYLRHCVTTANDFVHLLSKSLRA